MLYDIFMSLFGRTESFEREMLVYAKTEFKDDWRYAYHYMINHRGHAPKMGVTW